MSARFVTLPQRRLFLSCVSHEFRSYRDILATNLAQPGVELRRQEDFVNSGSTTVEKLDDYIRTCDAVIHLVGHSTGAFPVRAAVEALLDRCPDLTSKFGLQELMQPPGLSYTQWEAWLALYHGKPLALYRAADIAQRELGFAHDPEQRRRQQLHWKCLTELGRDRGKEFVSPYDLSIEILRALPLLVPGFAENVRRGQFRDRNLLFAVLALQDEIISREAFVNFCTLWATDTDQPIAELMQREGRLTPEDRLLVEARLERKLKARGGDARVSLAESLGSDVRQSLGEALDPSTLASLPDRMAALSSLAPATGQWRYKLTRTQGSGGLGIVSVAADTVLDRDVAVKQLRSERMFDPMAIERFVREARITGRLQHPNIVPVYELGLSPDDQIPFYAMRFVGHHTLQDVVTRHYADKAASESDRNVRFRKLLQSFVSVCNAVAYAHDQGVIHRDLKPANVIIGDFGEVILLDWGLAKRLDEVEPAELPKLESGPTAAPLDAGKTQAGVKLGSPAYMAPEQAAGRVDLHGTHTDIYCLGATLYEILTGDVPFTGASTDELLSAIQSRPLRDPREHNPRVAPALSAICRKAVEKRPEDRYATAKELAEDIQHWLADEPVSVFSEPVVMRLQRATRKNPGPLAALAASLLVGMIGLGGGLYFVNAEKNQKELALEQKQKALQKAKTQTELAESQTILANGRYDQAIEALNFLVFDVQNKLEGKPGLRRVRKELLSPAADGLTKLLKSGLVAGSSLSAVSSLGTTHQKLGVLWVDLGDLVRADAEFQQAIIWRKLLADSISRDDDLYGDTQAQLGDSYRSAGFVLLQMRRELEARPYFENALTIHKQLAADQPENPDRQCDLMRSYWRLGDVNMSEGRLPEAGNWFREALETTRKFAMNHPNDRRAADFIAETESSLAKLCQREGDLLAARRHSEESLKIRKQIDSGPFTTVDTQRNLATAYFTLGEVIGSLDNLTQENWAESRRAYQESLDIRKKCAADDFENVEMQRELGLTYLSLAQLEAAGGDLSAARDLCDQSLDIYRRLVASDPSNGWVQVDFAIACTEMGNVRMAAAESNSLKYFQEALNIYWKQAADDPENAQKRANFAGACHRICPSLGDAEAKTWYARFIDILQPLADAGKFPPQSKEIGLLDELRRLSTEVSK